RNTMKRITVILVAVVATATLVVPLRAQAGKGLSDPNVAGDKDLLGLPHMTPAIVKDLLRRRPFMTAVELHAFLLGQKLTPAEIADFYRKAFVQINVNAGSPEELALIPGAPKDAIGEIGQGRPWKSLSQLQTAVEKAGGQAASDHLLMYVFVPI